MLWEKALVGALLLVMMVAPSGVVFPVGAIIYGA
jgi:hypothetical protein